MVVLQVLNCGFEVTVDQWVIMQIAIPRSAVSSPRIYTVMISMECMAPKSLFPWGL